MNSVAIIIVNWNQPALTLKTLDSLFNIDYPDYKIFLVDNHSGDNSYKTFTKALNNNQKVDIISSPTNSGYVGGNNLGLSIADQQGFEYFLLLNNDVLVKKDFLTHLVNEAKRSPTVGILGPKIYFAPGHEFHSGYHKNEIGKVIWSAGGQMDWRNILGSNRGVDEVDRGQYDQSTSKLDFLTGCCLLIKKSLYQKIGGLDQKYFMYLEDFDYCQRAKRAGYRLLYVPKSVIWHINSGSSRSGGSLHDYFIIRNRLLTGTRYASLRTKIALYRESVQFLFQSNIWKRKAVIDFYLGRLGRGSWPKI